MKATRALRALSNSSLISPNPHFHRNLFSAFHSSGLRLDTSSPASTASSTATATTSASENETDGKNPDFDSSQYDLPSKILEKKQKQKQKQQQPSTWDEKYSNRVSLKIFGEVAKSRKGGLAVKEERDEDVEERKRAAAMDEAKEEEEEDSEVKVEVQKSLSVGIIGAPNAGKSALTSYLVGTNVADVSLKTNTTAHEVLGVMTQRGTQICFFDIPGLMLKKTGYPSKDTQARIESAWSSINLYDVLIVIFDVHRHLARPDSRVVRLIHRVGSEPRPEQKRILCMNKVDLVKKKTDLLKVAEEFKDLAGYEKVFMISGLKGSGVKDLAAYLMEQNGLIGNTSAEVLDRSSTPKPFPKQNTTSSKKKKSSPEGAAVEPNGAMSKVKKNHQSSKKQKPIETVKSKQQAGKSFRPLYPPSGKSVVVVESITKAKVIQGYLGNMYEVIPSYGHVRDLAPRSGSVRPDEEFSMLWEVPSSAWTHLKSIKVAISGADNLILASDPDREGEAIAWHVIEMLQQQDSLREDLTIARVVFQEITESAIKKALQNPRDIDYNLVHAYLARRALDYLIGFNISPLLWRKLPGCPSAGRVQSAALALICDRENEIDEFKPQEYWTIEALFGVKNLEILEGKNLVPAHLSHFNSKKFSQLSVGSEAHAKSIEQALTSSEFKVISVKKSSISKNPLPPYITSTLQQDAANKLNFSATHTMKLAQKLYEGIQLSNGDATGLITYLRTDGVHISDEAVQGIRSLVMERYGERFASSSPRKYFQKVKNAQEAHEAIRPTDIQRIPSMLVGMLDEDSLKLYALIWSRTVACQMEPSKIAQLLVNIGNNEESVMFRASCSSLEFPGFRAVYEDVEAKELRSRETEKDDNKKSLEILGHLKSGDVLHLGKVDLKQHHTQGPPRYSEASLVKKLEELGIGRPSTYATTIRVLQDRKYMTTKSRVLYPEFRGRMVSAFLMHYFAEVMDYSFTADMENELDNVSSGLTEWKGLLKDYWTRFSSYCNNAGKVDIHQVEKMLERTFEDSLFSSFPDRSCPSCLEGVLVFKVSKFGAGYFIGCDQHPRCKYIAKTLYGAEEEDDDDSSEKSGSVEEPKLLGVHPVSNEKVLLKNGPYGAYVQLGEDRKGCIPKRSSVSQLKNVSEITLEDALELLRYPLTLGYHPDDNRPIILKLARVGFTIRYRRHIATVPKSLKPSEITLEKALKLLNGKGVRRCGRPKKQHKPQQEEDDEDDEALGAY